MSTKKIIFFIIFYICPALAKEVITPAIAARDKTITIPMVDQRVKNKKDLKYAFYGYIKLDAYPDTRQVIGIRGDQILFYPAPKLRDQLGRDITNHPQFHMSVVESRLGAFVTGPKWGKISSFGVAEIDFRGPTEETTHGLRLRYIFGRINFEHGNFIFGLFAHPLYVVECTPGVISGNSGAPFETLGRHPQLRYTYVGENLEVIAAINEQTDFLSAGPLGLSPRYLALAVVPDTSLEIRWRTEESLTGAVFNFKRLVPRLVTEKNFKTDEHINSFIGTVFFAYDFPHNFCLRTKLIWAQNAADQVMIAGYGVRTVDPITDCRTYTNTNCLSAWTDLFVQFCEKKQEIGLFAGYVKNFGASHDLFINPQAPQATLSQNNLNRNIFQTNNPTIYSFLATNPFIDYVARIAPRYVWTKDPLRIGAELEWTRASFGKHIAADGKPFDKTAVANLRFLLAFYYVF